MYIYEKYLYFWYLKLEIALAIPDLNDEKYNWNNSAGQGLNRYSCKHNPVAGTHSMNGWRLRSIVCYTYRLNWVRRTSRGWWDESDDIIDIGFKIPALRFDGEHTTYLSQLKLSKWTPCWQSHWSGQFTREVFEGWCSGHCTSIVSCYKVIFTL